ncbi:MAG: hypothetical protein HQL27_05190 [Candidatus Omnitrophica bacterium]|nr:hypothetical protein [Candidatus Omnitrophota bacterium]
MSIIHDALKKTQANLEGKSTKNTIEPNSTEGKKDRPSIVSHSPSSKASRPEEQKSRTPYLFAVLIILVIAVVAYYFFYLPSGKSNPLDLIRSAVATKAPSLKKQEVNKLPQASLKTTEGVKLNLEGTMMMGDKRVALINGEVYQIGESVNGLIITDISLNKVLLKDGENTITLGPKE